MDITTLGHLKVTMAGRSIALTRVRDRAMLAFLSVNKGRSFRRDYLADMFWPKAEMFKARHSLSQSLYSIQSVVGRALNVSKSAVSISHETVSTDLDVIAHHLRSGSILDFATRIHGAFLEDLIIDSAPDFNDWRENYGTSLFLQLDSALLAALKVLSPKEINLQFALWGSVTPDLLPECNGFFQEFDTLLPEAAEAGGAPTDIRLLGRLAELRTIDQAFEKVRGGDSESRLIVAPAGYGKTRLLREIIESYSAEARVLLITCREAERSMSLRPVIDTIRDCVTNADLEAIAPLWRNALSQFGQAGGSQILPGLSAVAETARFFEAFAALIHQMSTTMPVIIAVDDTQWCDQSTSALISYAQRRNLQNPVFMIATIRAPVRARGWLFCRQWQVIGLGKLRIDDLSRLDESIDAADLIRVSGGHPYLVTELIKHHRPSPSSRAIRFEAPQSIEAFIRESLDRLPQPARRIAQVLAAADTPISERALRHLVGTKEVKAGLQQLVDKELVRRVRGGFALSHDLLQEIVYKGMSRERSRDLHAQIANVLAASGGNAGTIARHYYRARLKCGTLEYAKKAALEAEARGDLVGCARFLRMSLATGLNDSTDARMKIVECLYRAHRLVEARQEIQALRGLQSNLLPRSIEILDFELAYALGHTSGASIRDAFNGLTDENSDEEHRIRIVRLKLRATINDGFDPSVQILINELKSWGETHLESESGIQALAGAIRAHSHVTSATQALAWSGPLHRAMANRMTPELRIQVLTMIGGVFYEHGDLSKAEALHREALGEIDRVGAMNLWYQTAVNLHVVLVEQGRYDEARELARQMRSRTASNEALQQIGLLSANEALMHLELGQLKESRDCAREALAYFESFNSVWSIIGLRGLLGLTSLSEGKIDEATKHASFGEEMIQRHGARIGDISCMEILIARIANLRKREFDPIERLQKAADDYKDRDAMCRLRIRLELVNQLRKTRPIEARGLAKHTSSEAKRMSAWPIADRAESVLCRI